MEEKENYVKQEKNSNVQVMEKTEKLEENIEKVEIEEKQIKPTEEKKSKLRLIIVITTILLIAVGLFSTVFAIINMGNNKIIKGVSIGQIDISKMTKKEAKKALEEIYSQKTENEIYLKSGEYETTTTYKALEVQYQIDKAIEQAHEIGRKGNVIKDNFNILKSWIKGNEIELDVTIDQEMLNQIVENINNSIDGAVVQSDYYQENDKLIITAGKQGLKVEEKQLFEKIYKAIKDEAQVPIGMLATNDEENIQTQIIEIPTITAMPDKINIEKIHEEVYKKVQDAYYTQDPFTIHPEVAGVDFDVENAKKLLEEEKEQYEIPLIITKPSKTTREIGTEAFPDLISSFSTNYQASNVNRTTNLKLAANKINGTVLLPGEEFSYNKTVGERTPQAGFKNAPIFSAGKVVDGIGGGICQISTTLYDAVVQADLEITKRRNHQFVTSYVPAGKDATVVWGSQDFKFKNTRKYPVRITATVQGGVATVQVWGLREEVEYDITIETKKTATIPFTTQYVQDASLPAGQQKVVQQGNNGRKVEAYKVKKLNGQVVSRTLLSKDTYNAMNKIVHVGKGQ